MAHVTMIHGIGNKPPDDRLLASWVDALADDSRAEGVDLPTGGVSSSMVYWADVMYDEPGTAAEAHESTGPEVITPESDEDVEWIDDLDDEESAFVDSLRDRLGYEAPSPQDDAYQPPRDAEDGSFEGVPIPWFVKRRLMKAFLRDVHHYLFNDVSKPRGEEYRVQDEIRRRFVDDLRAARAGAEPPHIVLSHSMGTVIAYDCLKRVPDCPRVDALLTIGSPLGIDEIQELLEPEWTREDGYPSSTVASSWGNVYDSLDIVAAADTNIANDYQKGGVAVVEDHQVRNHGAWRHNIAEYLQRDDTRMWLRGQLGWT